VNPSVPFGAADGNPSSQPLLSETASRGKTDLPALKAWTGDFDGMQKRRLTRVLVPYSKTIYFIDKGERFGTAFEFGRQFEKWITRARRSRPSKSGSPSSRHRVSGCCKRSMRATAMLSRQI
jgi:hypothetical protein